MSDVTLLDKTRKIGQLLHNNRSAKVAFTDICGVCSEILKSNVLAVICSVRAKAVTYTLFFFSSNSIWFFISSAFNLALSVFCRRSSKVMAKTTNRAQSMRYKYSVLSFCSACSWFFCICRSYSPLMRCTSSLRCSRSACIMLFSNLLLYSKAFS